MKRANFELIQAAAEASSPCEACGVIVSVDGSERAIQLKNISETPTEHFIIDPTGYLDAEKVGEIVAIWHTHPATLNPSDADRTACNRSGLPWHIYSMVDGGMRTLYPDGRDTPLLGRSFVWGVHDCWTLVQDYYRQELGLVLDYPVPYQERFWERGEDHYSNYAQVGFVRIVGIPAKHDLLLMRIHSRVPNHGAVFLGDGHILHHLQARLSCRDVYGGYWRSITSDVLRHRSQL